VGGNKGGLNMLKIKDNVGLKELEKFRFRDIGVYYKRPFLFGGEIYINKETRKITRMHPYSLREEPNEDEIRDLIKANLVEKVSD